MPQAELFDLEDDEDQIIKCPSCGHRGGWDDFDVVGNEDEFVFCNAYHCGNIFRIHERAKR